MSEVLTFELPAGYRVTPTESDMTVVCDRGCGWKMRVATLSALPTDARDGDLSLNGISPSEHVVRPIHHREPGIFFRRQI